jgi:4-diphosphocytidyl-2-C-methyl-D-erythritol kinase
MTSLHERAYAKVNLVLRVGPPREDGLHPLASVLACIDLADELTVSEADTAGDSVDCPGLPNETLCRRALEALRTRLPDLPPVKVEIDKRIPVAAGLGGGSADAAAVLRAGNQLAGAPLSADDLRELGAGIGSDVPSQVEPGHCLIQGVGEKVEPLALPAIAIVLVPATDGLSTADVYAEHDRHGRHRDDLEPERLRLLAKASVGELADAVENDLQPAAVALRSELEQTLGEVAERGALAAAVSGSGPTVFGLFGALEQAQAAAQAIDGALAVSTR